MTTPNNVVHMTTAPLPQAIQHSADDSRLSSPELATPRTVPVRDDADALLAVLSPPDRDVGLRHEVKSEGEGAACSQAAPSLHSDLAEAARAFGLLGDLVAFVEGSRNVIEQLRAENVRLRFAAVLNSETVNEQRREMRALESVIRQVPRYLRTLIDHQDEVFVEVAIEYSRCPSCGNRLPVRQTGRRSYLCRLNQCRDRASYLVAGTIFRKAVLLPLREVIFDTELMPAQDQARFIADLVTQKMPIEFRCSGCRELKQGCTCPEGLDVV